MNYRDFLQQVIYRIINPLIRAMIKAGITPNAVTFTGFAGNCVGAAFFIAAAGSGHPFCWIGWGGFVLLLSGLFDMMDGRLAREGHMSSRFGAFWDSTLDRYSELVSLSGLAVCLFGEGGMLWGIVTLAALTGSIMVSYVRARAEALGLECKAGIMQRSERVVVLSLGALLTGIIGSNIAVYVAVAVIAVLANFTAFYRIWYCRRQMKD